MTKRILSLTMTLICITLFCLPSYAMAEPDAEETYPPLTEEGNMTVTDDIYQLIVEKITQTGEDGTEVIETTVIENKQFITVHTRSGAEFYIVIDRSRDSENVYFLNQVDDDDLFALLEANDSATPCTCAEKCAAGEVNTDCAVCRMNMKSCAGKEVQKAEVTETLPEPEQKKANPMPIVVLILLIGGGAAVYFLKFRKNKPKTSGTTDLDDYDYGEEDETEYEGDEENE